MPQPGEIGSPLSLLWPRLTMIKLFSRWEMAVLLGTPALAIAVAVAIDVIGIPLKVVEAIDDFMMFEGLSGLSGLALALLWISLRRWRTVSAELRKREAVEKALRESEARFRAIYDNAGAGILLASPQGTIQSANKAFQNIVGYSEEELQKTAWQTLIHPEDGVADRLRDAAARGQIARDNSVERRFVRKNGDSIWIKMTSSYAFDADGRPSLGIAIAEDVTARRRAEEALRNANDELEHRVDQRTRELRDEIGVRLQAESALRESEMKFRALIENALDFVVVVDKEGIIQFQSPSLAHFFRVTDGELVGKSTFDGIHPADLIRVKEEFFRLVEVPGSTNSVQYRISDGHNGWRIVEANSKNLLLDPIVSGVVVNSRDITERFQAEENARTLQTELAHVARLSTMGEMAAGFAHELNQPLTAIQNYASGCVRRLQAGVKDSDELIRAMTSTAKQAQRAGEIIRRIRWFIRRDEPELTPIDINAVIREAIDLMENEAHHAGVAIQLDLAADIPWARADTIQVQQIVINLVRNAIEAMVLESLGPRELRIQTRAISDEQIEITIRDTGPGIPAEIRDLMFDPFFTTKSDGMGMGLAICRSIIERHGGKIYLGTEEGAGTDIRFTLRSQLPTLPAGTTDVAAGAHGNDGSERPRYN